MRKIEIELSVADRGDLDGMSRKCNDYRSERALAVLHCALGESARPIAVFLHRTEKTVRSWLNAYLLHRNDGLSRSYSPGRPTGVLQACLCFPFLRKIGENRMPA